MNQLSHLIQQDLKRKQKSLSRFWLKFLQSFSSLTGHKVNFYSIIKKRQMKKIPPGCFLCSASRLRRAFSSCHPRSRPCRRTTPLSAPQPMSAAPPARREPPRRPCFSTSRSTRLHTTQRRCIYTCRIASGGGKLATCACMFGSLATSKFEHVW